MTWVRAGTSVLALGAGAFVLGLCLDVLLGYPIQQSEIGDPAGRHPSALVVFPLLLSAGVLVALLLLWSGARGALAAADPGRWRHRQRVALYGCLLGALLAGSVALAAGRPWTGLPADARVGGLQLLVFASLLAFMIMIALSAEADAR